jgi:hypothetical protein
LGNGSGTNQRGGGVGRTVGTGSQCGSICTESTRLRTVQTSQAQWTGGTHRRSAQSRVCSGGGIVGTKHT